MDYHTLIDNNKINSMFNYKTNFINITNEENIPSLFIDAISNYSYDEAKKYISKSLVNWIDFDELVSFFEDSSRNKFIDFMCYFKKPRNCKTILVSKGNIKSIINIYLVLEPDRHSKWKIYAIDKESSLM